MSPPPILAHGGTAGAALEVTFLLLPVALFAFFAWRSNRRRQTDAAPDHDGPEHGSVDEREPE